MTFELSSSPGLFLLAAICSGDTTVHPADLDRDLFNDAEQIAYDILSRHLEVHRVLPDASVFRDSGIPFPLSVTQPASYYKARCQRRKERQVITHTRTALEQELRKTDAAPSSVQEILSNSMLEVQRFGQTQSISADHEYYQLLLDRSRTRILTPNERVSNINLGYPTMHEHTGGAAGGDIFVLAGRPNQGKSYILINMALKQVLQNKKILFFTMEMSPEQVSRRALEMTLGLPTHALQSGELSFFQQRRLSNYIQQRQTEDVQPFLLPNDVKLNRTVAEIARITEIEQPDVVFIDGVYLLKPSASNNRMDRREKIAEVFGELKHTSLRLNKPFITTTQLNRQAQSSGTRHRPLDLTHLGETDVIGQIASVVVALTKETRFGSNKRLMDVIKNRDGPLHRYLINFEFNPHNFNFDRELSDEEFETGTAPVEAEAWA